MKQPWIAKGWLLILMTGLATMPTHARAEDGYDLWLRYGKIQNPELLENYRARATQIVVPGDSPVAKATREELRRGLKGLLGEDVAETGAVSRDGAIVVDVQDAASNVLKGVQGDGYRLRTRTEQGKQIIAIEAKTERGGLYGAFAFLRLLQTNRPIDNLNVLDNPKIQYRVLNHWDQLNDHFKDEPEAPFNPDDHTNRLYAGRSLWFTKWDELPAKVDRRFTDYARANASVGINGTVLNSVTADSRLLTSENLKKVAALADAFRPYGLRVYLSINLNAPLGKVPGADSLKLMGIGGLETADPLAPEVAQWWKAKADEIYGLIPDFGGFLVKAGSEGMPGPKEYKRSNAEAAGVLAAALAPHHGILMYRAFVYDTSVDADRAKRAYKDFKPLDGSFSSNTFVQVKNGPLDFQPREPLHPLWGAMPKTQLMMELEVKQEYMEQTWLVYLGEEWQAILQADTFQKGKGSTVARIIDGSLGEGSPMTGIAGVANIGNHRDWCGSQFTPANWYAFGRLGWDPDLKADGIAEEWTRMTWGNDPKVASTIVAMMKGSWQAAVDGMTPLGMNLICGGDHYSPNPASRIGDYWQANETGIGYNRTNHPERGWIQPVGNQDGHKTVKADPKSLPAGVGNDTGTDAASEYNEPLRSIYNDMDRCPEEYLLWFHFVPWDRKMQSGRTLWDEFCFRYDRGLEYVRTTQSQWESLRGSVDPERFAMVEKTLSGQEEHIRNWRDTCLNFFANAGGRTAPPAKAKAEEEKPGSH